jgi:GT2 family glycosyltransferase
MAEPPTRAETKPRLGDRVTVVIATRDRCGQLLHSLSRLTELPDPPPIVVVDNGSADGTVANVRAQFAQIEVIALPENRGAVARNAGVLAAETPYVAFADDDSWWAPGALERAADVMDEHGRIALVAATVLVGDDEHVDPASTTMAASPLAPPPGSPGRGVLGFLACGAIVRRAAYLEVGGFDDVVFFLGEEERVAWDLAANGHSLVYVPDVVAHHHPNRPADPDARRVRQERNAILSAVLRRPWRVVLRRCGPVARHAVRRPWARRTLVEAARVAPVAVRRRRLLPRTVEDQIARVESAPG